MGWLYARESRNTDFFFIKNKVKQNYRKAVGWYRKAADQGDVNAQINLGWLYYRELRFVRSIRQDYEQAAQLFGKAAEQGHPLAQIHLGFMYQEGRGVEQDHAKAAEWYRKAAEQGDVHGQIRLAWLYQSGKGVKQDYARAIALYRKATNAMDDAGVWILGARYARYPTGGHPRYLIVGYDAYKGWERHIPMAYTLLLISERKVKLKNKSEKRQARVESVGGELTAEQRVDAEKVAEAWSEN